MFATFSSSSDTAASRLLTAKTDAIVPARSHNHGPRPLSPVPCPYRNSVKSGPRTGAVGLTKSLEFVEVRAKSAVDIARGQLAYRAVFVVVGLADASRDLCLAVVAVRGRVTRARYASHFTALLRIWIVRVCPAPPLFCAPGRAEMTRVGDPALGSGCKVPGWRVRSTFARQRRSGTRLAEGSRQAHAACRGAHAVLIPACGTHGTITTAPN
eukprot:4156735-Prymnesium_polylepis.1